MKVTGMVLVSLSTENTDFGLIWGVKDEKPIFLAVKLSFGVVPKEIKYAVILFGWSKTII